MLNYFLNKIKCVEEVTFYIGSVIYYLKREKLEKNEKIW